MAVQSFGASNYLYITNMPITAYPILIHFWLNRASTDTNFRTVIQFYLAANGNHRYVQMRYRGSDNIVQAAVYDASTFVGTPLTTLQAASQWHSYFGSYVATNSREIFADGANKASDTSADSPSTPDRIQIGATPAAEDLSATDGVAEISIWDGTAFTSGNRDSLATKLYNGGAAGAGGNPLLITAEAAQPWSGKLRAYWTLNNTTDTNDQSGNAKNLSTQGTLTNFGSHPTIESGVTTIPLTATLTDPLNRQVERLP